MSGIGGMGTSYNPLAILQQSLFNEIDTAGNGSFSKTDLETAVTKAGGTSQAADALYADLDPNNSGAVNQQQFSQNLPLPSFSPSMGLMMIGLQAGNFGGPTSGGPGGQFAQSLFNSIDTGGTGSITKSQLEQAVTAAGGTTQGADALYALLDPNNTGSVNEQQFAQVLNQLRPHHHHHGGGDGNSAQDALTTLLNELNGTTSSTSNSSSATATSPAGLAQTLFNLIDTDNSGSITQSELETAVTKAGGTTQAADALYAQLDPNNTGRVSEDQLAQFLQPTHPIADTPQDALLALIQGLNNSSGATNGTSGATNSTSTDPTSTVGAVNGSDAQSALNALVSNLASTQTNSVTGNSAQDALLALLNGDASGSSQDPLLSMLNSGNNNNPVGLGSSGSSTSPIEQLIALMQANASNSSSGNSVNQLNLDSAMRVYQAQLAQQSMMSMFGNGTTGV
jgi:Ca2+-binding EF-hand superfamily protein